MQLNNLVIIPISQEIFDALHFTQSQPSSPTKNIFRNSILKDQFPWKKSHSAFKRFKNKKDKQRKSHKISKNNLSLLDENQDEPPLERNYSLVDIDLNQSVQKNQQQTFKDDQCFTYYDPNIAPFFQFGLTYHYLSKQGRIQIIEDQKAINTLSIKLQSPKLKRQPSRKEKVRLEVPDKKVLTNQKIGQLTNNKIQQAQHFDDPFIIIKCLQKKVQTFQQGSREDLIRRQDLKKTKSIKKGLRISQQSMYKHSNLRPAFALVQQRQKSQESYSFQIQLPFIQFDLYRHINSTICLQKNGNTDDPNDQRLWEMNEDLKCQQQICNDQIIQEYTFQNSKSDYDGQQHIGSKKNRKQTQQVKFKVQLQEK